MLTIYTLIIVLTFSIFGVTILNNYKINGIKNEKTRLFQTANIVADAYKRNQDDIVYARIIVKSYADQAGARLLVVTKDSSVIVDNYNTYLGSNLNNNEIRSSFSGLSTSDLYFLDEKPVLQLSVPITINNGNTTEVIGAVLVSASMEGLYSDVDNLRKEILKISTFSILVAIILTAISATGITKSLRDLTYGVEKVSSGHLGYRIEKEAKGEVGKLLNTFNDMSDRLYNIEKNRKSFINSISHELKTPLTSIKALIDSLFMGNNTIDIYNEYLTDIKGETERMEDLVNYLMGSIKLEDISLDIRKENISEVIEDTVKLITPYAEKNEIQIKLNLQKNLFVSCDKNKLREVLLNIIENGIKYKDNDKPNHYVLIKLNKVNNRVLIEIEDNGKGISEVNLTHIFKRGFRVLENHIPNRDIEGYGIGLALVKNIITKHNWTIDVKSEVGIGTIFTIII